MDLKDACALALEISEAPDWRVADVLWYGSRIENAKWQVSAVHENQTYGFKSREEWLAGQPKVLCQECRKADPPWAVKPAPSPNAKAKS